LRWAVHDPKKTVNDAANGTVDPSNDENFVAVSSFLPVFCRNFSEPFFFRHSADATVGSAAPVSLSH